MTSSTDELLRLLAENSSVAFEAAKSLPPACYFSEEFLQLEIDNVFRKQWICLGRTAEMPLRGDYICRKIIDSPVFAIRQKDDSIRAFANVCVHRGAQLLFGDGHASRISCPYHSWTYNVEGQLVGAPFMDKTSGFDTADFRLKQLPCETWEGFIYVSLDPEVESITPQLTELAGLIGPENRGAGSVPRV